LFSVSCNVADSGDILNEPSSESTPEAPENSKPYESSSNLEESLQPEESKDVSPEESSYKAEETNVPSGSEFISYPTFEIYEEYLEYIGSVKNLPDDFITYDMLKSIGDFYGFICTKTFSGYWYILIAENNKWIFVRVNELPDRIKSRPIVEPQNINDLRNVTPTGGWADYSHNNITYSYFDGMLESIDWAIGTKFITLTVTGGTRNFVDYPLGGETFVSQLLSTQTATAAVQSFNQNVEAEIAKNIANKQFES
jgi:hypothetical protein